MVISAAFMMSERNPVGEEYLSAVIDIDCLEISSVIIEVSDFSRKCETYNNSRMGGLYKARPIEDTLHCTAIPVYLVKKHTSGYTKILLNDIRNKLDVVIAGGVGGILKNDLLNIPKLGFVGCHPGLLPDIRGSNVIANAIVDNKPVGATCFFMDEGIDTGDIIYKERMNVYLGDTYEMLEARMLQHAGKVLRCGIQKLINDPIREHYEKQCEGYEYKANEHIVQQARQKLLNREYKHYVK